MITPNDLGGDEDIARRVLVRARTIAPCIDSLAAGSEERKNAIAILKGVIAELPQPGMKNVKSQTTNNASVTYRDIAGAFDGDAEASLRSLCEAAAAPAGLPQGSFPVDTLFDRLWPEGPYT